MNPQSIRIEAYNYDLPEDRIARYPLPERDASRLLVYNKGQISEATFKDLPDQLPANSLLVFNQTKVIHARLLFRKPSGALIELFCLEPHSRYPDVPTAMISKEKVWWQCLVGGAAKWKNGTVLTTKVDAPVFTLSANIIERNGPDFVIEFSWDDASLTFAEVLQAAGKVPLPPYLNRAAEPADESRYQTLFAKEEGSVAAPTASLHFTPAIMSRLGEKGIKTAPLTLHVGAGTFKPVKSETVGGHSMHAEWIEVNTALISRLLDMAEAPVVAIGTTALRTLESLYWMGCKLVQNASLSMEDLVVNQWEPYEQEQELAATVALQAINSWLLRNKRDSIITKTQIMIAPGYRFRIVNGLITNFHQPQSTLLLLVAAMIGTDWETVYAYAMRQGFRFLSYGDGSLLWRNE